MSCRPPRNMLQRWCQWLPIRIKNCIFPDPDPCQGLGRNPICVQAYFGFPQGNRSIVLDPDQDHRLRPDPDVTEAASVFADMDPYPYNTGSGSLLHRIRHITISFFEALFNCFIGTEQSFLEVVLLLIKAIYRNSSSLTSL